MNSRRTISEFHRLFYDSKVYRKVFWRGHQVLKCPMDLVIYQDIMHRVRPSTIVELGTRFGGSALFFADMLQLMLPINQGRVISIDTDAAPARPQHSLITYITGDVLDLAIVGTVVKLLVPPVLVVLDADHSRDHVATTLNLYAPLVTVGSYCIVEDTNLGGNPVRGDLKSHPLDAVGHFMARHPEFKRDENCERFLLSFNPGGYLKRVST